MNLMLASGGYKWTIVRNSRRKQYLESLEAASSEQKIELLAEFIREEMSVEWEYAVSERFRTSLPSSQFFDPAQHSRAI